MRKAFSILTLAAALFTLAACATTDSSTERTRYKTVNASAAKDLFDREALFVDVRSKASYDEGHIPGAVNLTWGRKFNPARLSKVASLDQPVVFYCYGIHCELSAKATESAVTWGYQKVHYFVKGYPAWLNAGYPVEQ